MNEQQFFTHALGYPANLIAVILLHTSHGWVLSMIKPSSNDEVTPIPLFSARTKTIRIFRTADAALALCALKMPGRKVLCEPLPFS